jgi:hypothetical protein
MVSDHEQNVRVIKGTFENFVQTNSELVKQNTQFADNLNEIEN